MPSDEIIETMARASKEKYLELAGVNNWGSTWPSDEPMRDITLAALSAAEAGGWVMVPKKPTGAMIRALWVQPDIVAGHIVRYSVDKIPAAYAAMIEARP